MENIFAMGTVNQKLYVLHEMDKLELGSLALASSQSGPTAYGKSTYI